MGERYDESLRLASLNARALRSLAERGEINSAVILGLMESYLDQPGFAREDRPALLRDALGADWESWRANNYRIGHPKPD